MSQTTSPIVVVPQATATDKTLGIEMARFSDGLYFRPLMPKNVMATFWTPVPSDLSQLVNDRLSVASRSPHRDPP